NPRSRHRAATHARWPSPFQDRLRCGIASPARRATRRSRAGCAHRAPLQDIPGPCFYVIATPREGRVTGVIPRDYPQKKLGPKAHLKSLRALETYLERELEGARDIGATRIADAIHRTRCAPVRDKQILVDPAISDISQCQCFAVQADQRAIGPHAVSAVE